METHALLLKKPLLTWEGDDMSYLKGGSFKGKAIPKVTPRAGAFNAKGRISALSKTPRDNKTNPAKGSKAINIGTPRVGKKSGLV